MTYKTALIKIKLERIGMFPFVLLGKLYGKIFPLRTPHPVFLFFSSADVGGAIQVNADIIQCIKHKKPLIIFSKKPKNNGFKRLFEMDSVQTINLYKKIDNKLFHFVNFFYRGVLATWINNTENAVVFGGECLFFYKVIPHLKNTIVCIELCHLATWLEYNIGFIDQITYRIFSTKKLKEDVIAQYQKNRIASALYERLHFIENKIDIPAYKEVSNERLEVVFIGRGAPQKRVHLVAAIATKMNNLKAPVHFSFIGDVEKIIDIKDFPYCTFWGNIKDEMKMKAIYQQSDVLLLTSSYEGLPLVVMEMMAYGKVVVSTAINAIPDYIAHMQNGLLITATNEDEIIIQGTELLLLLIADPKLKTTLGRHSREIAKQKFDGVLFCKEYQKLFFSGNPAIFTG